MFDLDVEEGHGDVHWNGEEEEEGYEEDMEGVQGEEEEDDECAPRVQRARIDLSWVGQCNFLWQEEKMDFIFFYFIFTSPFSLYMHYYYFLFMDGIFSLFFFSPSLLLLFFFLPFFALSPI